MIRCIKCVHVVGTTRYCCRTCFSSVTFYGNPNRDKHDFFLMVLMLVVERGLGRNFCGGMYINLSKMGFEPRLSR